MELKIAIIIIAFSVTTVFATESYSQAAKVSLDMSNTTLEEVMDEIERQSEFYFIFNQKQIDVNRSVSIKEEDKLINEILTYLFIGTDVNYAVIDRKILLTTDPLDEKLLTSLEEPQQTVITGRIVDEAGKPMAGVNIQVEGTTIGTISDINGRYSINATTENPVIIFSFVGYDSQTVPAGGRTSIDISMVPSLSALQEVVVTGYGTQRKVDLTGSVASVSAEKILAVPVTRVDQALQGRAAGVLMRRNSFEPGSGNMTLIIRGLNSINGSNSPLYVVDGVIGASFNSIDPLDIQSIDILKDASAASIYGSQAANGVVMITTKRGVAGKAKISFDAYYGVSQAKGLYNVMNPKEYMEYVNDARTRNGQAISYPDIPGVLNQVGAGTDWQDELFQLGNEQKYYLSISGGTDNVTYSASGGYLANNGLMMNVNYHKYTARFNMDAQATKRLKFSTAISYANDVTNSMESTWGGDIGTINVIATPPTLTPYDEFGGYPPIIYNPYEAGSPKYYKNTFAGLEREIRESLGSYIQFNFVTEYKFTDWLKYNFSLGLQPTIYESRYFRPKDIPDPQYFEQAAYASKNSSRSNNWIVENLLTFNKTFNDVHNLTVIAGTTTQKYTYESTGASAKNMVFEQYQFHNLGTGTAANNTVSSSLSEQQLASLFSRLNYNYKGKYLLQVNGRADGSSKFAPGNKWAFFPSGSLGWRLSEESFIKDLGVFDDLKLRTSYGSIGSHGIGPYGTLARIGTTFTYGFNDARVGTYIPLGIANKELRWETTTQTDIGLDIGLLKGRLNFTLDYYYKVTSDLLLNQAITLNNNPTTNHNPTITQNIGSLQNTGFEFSVMYQSKTVSDFDWSIEFNGTFQKNKILELALREGQTSIYTGDNLRRNYQIMEEGKAFGNYVGYITDGLYQNQAEIDGSAQITAKPGDMKYIDQNGNGSIGTDDFVVLGNAYPDFFSGTTANLRYKNFDLSIFFFSMIGHEMFNYELSQWKYNLSAVEFNKFKDVATKRWTGEGTSNDIPRAGYKPVNITDGPNGAIDVMVEDASFIKLRNLTLNYNLPKGFVERANIANANVYIQGNNLFTITKYSGFDPESNQIGQSTVTLPINNTPYPETRSITIGLRLGF
ncbi:MAG: hypothetical protein A2X05_12520 [Bacteroidetes bacterium GWE2_41_25]|nr:MAG: hypothetical protein A2X03_18675 [Bacteroidetes bacterium GWA2_40_15]OFX84981.1 MAG: hypothetical protein A2X06_08060 [Bacteroidetes bacterium GWC2_40_22]OFX99852.1 MAG: hypothetical protein A2X05_12520 [Bacteroidetes bacterium GWE2_41_25]